MTDDTKRLDERIRRLESRFGAKPYAAMPRTSQGGETEFAVYPAAGGNVGVSVKFKNKWHHLAGPDVDVEKWPGFVKSGGFVESDALPPKPPEEEPHFAQTIGFPLRGGFGGGWISTASGKDDTAFAGDMAYFVDVVNTGAAAITAGEILSYNDSAKVRLNGVKTRNESSEAPAGVALTDMEVNESGRMAVGGYCDVFTLEDSADANLIQYADDSSTVEWKVQTDPTDFVLGIGVTGSGPTGYIANFVRVLLMIGGSTRKDFEDVHNATSEPTGFATTTSGSTLSWDDGTRTLTITPASSYDIWLKGVKQTITAVKTKQITDVEGMHHIYFDADGVLQETSAFTEDLLKNGVYVANLYWNATDSKVVGIGDERHGLMPWQTHLLWHTTMGTSLFSGGSVGDILADQDGSLDSHAEVSMTVATAMDEDIALYLGNLAAPANIPVIYMTGAGLWRKSTARNSPTIQFPAGRLAWNEYTGGAWQQTEVTNNDFVLTHIFASNDYRTGHQYIAIQGQAEYATKAQAREGANNEIASLVTGDLPMQEFVPLGTIIFECKDSYTNAYDARIVSSDAGDDYVDWRGSELSAGTAPTDHQNLTGRDAANQHPADAVATDTSAFGSLLSSADDEVQAALDTLDDLDIGDIPGLAANSPVITDASGFLIVSPAISLTEFNYLNGVTSLIQNQIDGKVAWKNAFLGDFAVYTDSLERLIESPTTKDELGYVHGVTSAIQTQLDSKVDTSGTPVANDFARFTDADTIEGRSYAETLADIGAMAAHSEDQYTALCSDGSGGIQAGPMFIDTSTGKNSYVFPGHYAQYLVMENGHALTAIEAGDLVCLIGTSAATIDHVQKKDTSHGASWRAFGVALEDIATGASGKIAIEGFCDAKTETSSTVIREIYSNASTAGSEHKVSQSFTNYSVGLSCGKSGSNYYNDGTDLWVRLQLNAMESS